MKRETVKNAYIPEKCIEQLKQRARKLKKSHNFPHHAALEQVAKETQVFANWHQICEYRKLSVVKEESLYSGLILIYDFEEGAKDFKAAIQSHKCPFAEDDFYRALLEDYFFKDYCNLVNDDIEEGESVGPTYLEKYGEAECRENFSVDFLDLKFFRYTGEKMPKTPKGVLGLLNKYPVFTPSGFLLKGVYYMRAPYTNLYKKPPFYAPYLKIDIGTAFDIQQIKIPNLMFKEVFYDYS
jgi:hypothetical protein